MTTPAGNTAHTPAHITWRTAWLWALRDLRRGGRGYERSSAGRGAEYGALAGMRIALACLVLGVAAIAMVGALRQAVEGGIDAQRRALLGGDLVIVDGQPLPEDLLALARQYGRVSQGMRTRTMLYTHDTQRLLVELRAEDDAWPLVGMMETTPPSTRLSDSTALSADALIARRLHLNPGDAVRVGPASFHLTGTFSTTPDAGSGVSLAPAVIIPWSALDATHLVQPGSIVTFTLRVALPGPDDTRPARVKALATEIARRFPDAGWRVRDVHDAAPGLVRTVDEVSTFMALIGLTALLLGGLGVSSGVRSWLEERRRTFAILRSLGAPPSLIGRMVLLQLGAICSIGIAAGAVIGTGAALLLARLGARVLPVAPSLAAPLAPVLFSVATGILVALLFACRPVLSGLRARPANLFRDDPSPVHGDARALVPLILIACALTALIVGASPDRKMATGFCVAIAAGFGVFTLLGRMVPRLVARIALSRMDTRARGAARLGIAFLDRANGPAPGLILALGMGLSGLATVHLLHGAVASQVDDVLPHSAPSFYFIDIQPSDVPRFDAVLHAQRTATTIREMPSMRTRVVALDGTPVAQVHATTASQWALRGDHGLTFSGEPPSDTHLAAGQWWATDYTGPPLLSLDAGLASGWGVHVGSTVTLNVLGRNLDFRIANLRDVAWRSLHMNFAFVASPGLLSHAPHSVIATVGTDGDAAHDADVLEAVTDALPGVTGIRVADVLATLSDMVTRLTQALAVMAVLVLMAGLLVIAATLFASGKQRLADTAILRALGATDRQIGTLWLVEFAVVGLTAGTMAALFGTMASLAAEHWLLRVPLTVQPVAVVEIIGGGLLLILIAGFLVQRPALRVRPTALFRV